MKLYCSLSITLLALAACSQAPDAPSAPASSCNKADWTCGLEEFQQLSIDNKLRVATAVVVTKNVREGSSIVEYVDKVIKLEPGTDLHLRPGVKVKVHIDSADYGDGSVAILRGSPASIVESFSYHDGAIRGLGNMPMSTFMDMARSAK